MNTEDDSSSSMTKSAKKTTEPDADNVSLGNWEDYVPQPPDGGWGWVIMVASFCNNFILDGIAYSFGVFLSEYAEYFQVSIAATSLANSLLCGVYLLVGPLVGALVNKFGCRAVGVAGSLLGAVAFLLSTVSPNIEFLIVTYGFIGGCAFGMMYLPAVVSVGYYFDKKRAIATGIAVCGTGVGTICLAPLAKILLEVYDWKNAHMILAGLILQGCISSALMRPLQVQSYKDTQAHQQQDHKSKDENQGADNNCLKVKSSNGTGNSSHQLHSSSYIKSGNVIVLKQDLARPLYKKDIFFGSSINNLAASRAVALSSSEFKNYTASVVTIPTDTGHGFSCLRSLPKPMADILAEMIDPAVLKHKGMMILSIANIIGMIGFYVPIMFTADRAKKLGVPATQAAFLLSIMGIFNTIGRVLSGFISTIPKISPLLVNNISIVLAGVSVIFIPFCITYTTMCVSIAFCGFFLSTYVSLASVIMCDLVGLEKLTNGFGWLCMVRGITAIAGPPVEGFLYDVTGSYDTTFYVGGICLVSSGLLHFMLHLQYFRQNDTNSKQQTAMTECKDMNLKV